MQFFTSKMDCHMGLSRFPVLNGCNIVSQNLFFFLCEMVGSIRSGFSVNVRQYKIKRFRQTSKKNLIV